MSCRPTSPSIPAQPLAASYKVITVQSHRRLSDSAAERFGIRHETPQAILLKDGRPVWNASHFRITADALTRAISIRQGRRACPMSLVSLALPLPLSPQIVAIATSSGSSPYSSTTRRPARAMARDRG